MYAVEDYKDSVYVRLGNLRTNQLDLVVVLENLYAAISKRIVELNLSSQNWLLKKVPVTLDGRSEYPLNADDFGTPVIVRVTDPMGGDAVGVEMVNVANFELARESGSGAVAFISDESGQTSVRLTAAQGGGRLEVWYEPDTPMPHELEASVPLRKLFKDFVVAEASRMCLPHVRYSGSRQEQMQTKQEIRNELQQDIMEWKDLWETEINRSKTQSKVIRQPFRAGR
jgi:hypothetical protein